MKHLFAAACVALAGMTGSAIAESWTLSSEGSRLAFGSIKKETVGEVHSFENLTGHVTADGAATIEIDLSSVETNIDIRNERMIEHVFKGIGSATITAQIEMDDVNGLAVGESTTTFAEGMLSLVGTEVALEVELFAVRLSDTQVMVTTNDMIFLSTVDAGIDAGITKLMEIAKLPGITRTTPVTLRFMFNRDEEKAEAAPAAPEIKAAMALDLTTLAGDAKKGRRVFAKCKACHQVKEGKNGAGPTLYQVFGATAGEVEGFKYSKAMAASDVVWTPETMAAFVANPAEFMPGTKMKFRGLKKDSDIENLIAYLAEKTVP